MITFKKLGRFGGLGNSLFQYSTLIAVAERYGYDIKIPYKNETFYEESYEANCYSIFQGFKKVYDNLEKEDLGNIMYEVSEAGMSYDPNLLNDIKDNTNLHGYFQCEKYFKDYRDKILQALIPTGYTYSFAMNFLNRSSGEEIDPFECTSVHVRRGDYLKKSDYYNILDKDYYQKSMEESNTKKYIFFSDDPEWCMENFKSDDYYFNKEEHSPYADLLCMSLCKNNIIANSSFSWWGAWMNQKEDKKVIAPKVWFNPQIKDRDKNYEDKDIVPESWIKI